MYMCDRGSEAVLSDTCECPLPSLTLTDIFKRCYRCMMTMTPLRRTIVTAVWRTILRGITCLTGYLVPSDLVSSFSFFIHAHFSACYHSIVAYNRIVCFMPVHIPTGNGATKCHRIYVVFSIMSCIHVCQFVMTVSAIGHGILSTASRPCSGPG